MAINQAATRTMDVWDRDEMTTCFACGGTEIEDSGPVGIRGEEQRGYMLVFECVSCGYTFSVKQYESGQRVVSVTALGG